MRKYHLLFLLVLISTCALAADNSSDKKLFIGVNFAPGVGFRTLHLDNHSNGYPEAMSLYQKYDKPIFGYNLGVDVTYKFTDIIGLQLGACYSMKGLLYSAPSMFSSTPTTYSTLYRFHFVDIPVQIRFYAGKSKVKFVGGAGPVFDLLFGQQNISEAVEGGKTIYHSSHIWLPAPKGPKVFTMSAMASAGIDYRINSLMGIRAEPYFSHGFLPLASNGIKTYLWNAGINCAFYFGVK